MLKWDFVNHTDLVSPRIKSNQPAWLLVGADARLPRRVLGTLYDLST